MSEAKKLWDDWSASENFAMAREAAVVKGGIDAALEVAFLAGVLGGVQAAATAQKEGLAEADALAQRAKGD